MQARRPLASTAATRIPSPCRLDQLRERLAGDPFGHLGRLRPHLLVGAHRAAEQPVPELAGVGGPVGECERPAPRRLRSRRRAAAPRTASCRRSRTHRDAVRQRRRRSAPARCHRARRRAPSSRIRCGPVPDRQRRSAPPGREHARELAGRGARIGQVVDQEARRPRRRSSPSSNASASASAVLRSRSSWVPLARASATMPSARSTPTGSARRGRAPSPASVPGPQAASSSRVPAAPPRRRAAARSRAPVTAPISSSSVPCAASAAAVHSDALAVRTTAYQSREGSSPAPPFLVYAG